MTAVQPDGRSRHDHDRIVSTVAAVRDRDDRRDPCEDAACGLKLGGQKAGPRRSRMADRAHERRVEREAACRGGCAGPMRGAHARGRSIRMFLSAGQTACPDSAALLASLLALDDAVDTPAVGGPVKRPRLPQPASALTKLCPDVGAATFRRPHDFPLLPRSHCPAKYATTEAWLRGRKHSVAN